jgi:hypothetical protein
MHLTSLWHGTSNAIASIADITSTLISKNRFKLQIKLLYLEHIRSLPNEFTVRSTRRGTIDATNGALLWYCIWYIVGLCEYFEYKWMTHCHLRLLLFLASQDFVGHYLLTCCAGLETLSLIRRNSALWRIGFKSIAGIMIIFLFNYP